MKFIKAAIKAMVCAVVFLFVVTFIVPPDDDHFFAGNGSMIDVTIQDHDTTHTYPTNANTVSDFLLEIGVQLNPLDRINHSTDSQIWEGINLVISREVEFEVQINHGQRTTKVVLPGTTVGQILVQQQFEHDLILLYNGEISRYVQQGETINFLTWDSRFYTEYAPLPYEIIENHTGAVREGRSHLRQEGTVGEHSVTSAIIIIGGVEQSRDVISYRTVSEPVPAIIDVGTAQLGELTDVTAPDFHYVRRLRMEATAYTSGYSCTGKHPWDPWYGITASGMRVRHGVVAVDRTVIPLGTRLYVEGYGFAIAADVGGAIRGYKIDLFMYNINDARRFGRRHINVWILD
ncbi:MAG: 3D domain-containing protein [Defluviitaleaceae bacterium]|nr:3D domain-containing protein [Defluviitaleaceae bacterium]